MSQTEKTTPFISDIEPALREFLHEKVNTFVKWDLVRFFHDNPHAADTAENIARYTGRDVRNVTDDLAGLVRGNVLNEKQVSGVMIYTLVEDQKMRDLINQFVLACDDRDFRVKAIQHVVNGMR